MVYVVDSNILSAFSTTSGSLLWRATLPSDGMGDQESGLLLQSTSPDGHLYYAYHHAREENIAAFDASSGHMLWHYQPDQRDGDVIDMVISNHVMYAVFTRFLPEENNKQEDKLIALDANNGKLKWSTTTSNYINAGNSQIVSLVHHERELVVRDGIVYQLLTSGPRTGPITGDYLFAWRTDTGALLWHSQNFLPATFSQHWDLFSITSDLIATGDALYVDTTAGMFAFGANDGSFRWMQPEGGAQPAQILRKEQVSPNWQKLEIGGSGSPESSFFVVGNTILHMEMIDQGSYIARLDARTGTVLSRQRVENFYCTQEQAWVPEGSQQATGITVIRQFQGLMTGTISYVFPSADHLDALDNQTGARLWSLQLSEAGPTVLIEGPW